MLIIINNREVKIKTIIWVSPHLVVLHRWIGANVVLAKNGQVLT